MTNCISYTLLNFFIVIGHVITSN